MIIQLTQKMDFSRFLQFNNINNQEGDEAVQRYSISKKCLPALMLTLILLIVFFNFLHTFIQKVDEDYVNKMIQRIFNKTELRNKCQLH